MSDERCSNCKFYYIILGYGDQACRRYPPVPKELRMVYNVGEERVMALPKVSPMFWCGEYKRKKND